MLLACVLRSRTEKLAHRSFNGWAKKLVFLEKTNPGGYLCSGSYSSGCFLNCSFLFQNSTQKPLKEALNPNPEALP